MDEQCTWYDVGCHLGNWIGSIGQTATDKLAQSVASAAQWALELSGDFIVNISGLTMFNQTEASWVQATLAPFVSSMAVVAVLVAAIQMIWHQRGEPARELVASLMRLVVVSGASMTGIILATQAADELATWLIQSSGGSGDFMANMASFVKLNEYVAPFAIVLAGIVAIVGALILAMLLLARGVTLTLLMGVLPLTAAASNTSWGQDWFKKASSWTVAFILYKPAVAIILALGYRLMGSPTAAQATASVDDQVIAQCGAEPLCAGPGCEYAAGNELGLWHEEWRNCADQVRAQLEAGGLDTTGAISFLQGLIIVCFAALAMPALIRFIMPAASAMSSGGGAALGALAGGVGTMVVAGGARHLGSSASASGNSGSTGAGGGGGGSPSGASATPGGGSGGGQSPGGTPADSGDAPGSSGGPSEGGAAGGGNTGGTPAGASPVTASGGGLAAVTAAYQVGSEVAGGVSAEVSGQTGDE
ncbi:type IV secretion system protein [Trueperella pyogenes]|uniref:hypothetical protein n=1 Tax=Trueperella pyogenes TaxID=1661 RepID=UPI00324A00D0